MTPPQRRDATVVAGVALALRLLVVAWGASAIPPVADGAYYHKVALRLAAGEGYTWLWPDGAVTYAAHYPIGYPAMVALGYVAFGTKPVVGMVLNAIVGSAAAVAIWSLVVRASSRRLALFAGLAVAVHPVLVPYTAAIMTEGVTAALLACAAAVAASARTARLPLRSLVVTGLVMGIATLVRPQCLALAPALGWLAVTGRQLREGSERSERTDGVDEGHRRFERPSFAAALVTALALAVCAPWTARNCARMERCALVSVNGGWNLAIGTQTDNGGWQEIVVPESCKTVFQEAAKDECFGREATKVIVARPGAWFSRAPAKLRATFDYFGAAPWYLHTANPAAFPYGAKVALGALETLVSRLLLAGALIALLRAGALGSPRVERLRKAVLGVGLVACVLVPGTIGYLALAVAVGLSWRAFAAAPLVVPFTALVILATALTHAVFFGAGRYGIVVVPFVTALAFVRPGAR